MSPAARRRSRRRRMGPCHSAAPDGAAKGAGRAAVLADTACISKDWQHKAQHHRDPHAATTAVETTYSGSLGHERKGMLVAKQWSEGECLLALLCRHCFEGLLTMQSLR
jgi:hypothetical protein